MPKASHSHDITQTKLNEVSCPCETSYSVVLNQAKATISAGGWEVDWIKMPHNVNGIDCIDVELGKNEVN